MQLQERPRLISGTLKRTLPRPQLRIARPGSEAIRLSIKNQAPSAEIDTNRLDLSKFSDPFGIEERTIDLVVDRLLRELSW